MADDAARRAAAARPPFVDAHVHLWDRAVLRYPWLEAPAQRPIASTYRLDDYEREAAAWNLVGCVHVDAGAHPDDGEAETIWLEQVAADHGRPDAIVARVALDDPDVDRTLAFHAAHPHVRGIRHLVNWHPHDAERQAYPRDLTRDPAWRRGYARLADHGLSFDFHGFPPQLDRLLAIAGAHPDVPLILNHLALPILADGLEEWRRAIAGFAALPHVAIKLSGAGFIHEPFDPGGFRDLVLEVIDRFGTERVMVATNFPTDRLFATMDVTLAAYEDILTAFSPDEKCRLWGANANRIYRMGLDL